MLLLEGLIGRHHPVQEAGREGESGDGLQQPDVAQLPPLHVKPAAALRDEPGPVHYLLRGRTGSDGLVHYVLGENPVRWAGPLLFRSFEPQILIS